MNWFRTVSVLLLLGVLCGCGQAVVLTVTAVDDTSASPLSGARIYIDGIYEGETNSAGQYVFEHGLDQSFRLGLEKTGYVPWQSLISETQTSVRAEMSRQATGLTVTVYDADTLEPVPDALVKVTGEEYLNTITTGVGGEAVFNLIAGSIYNVEVRATNYDPLYKTVEVENTAKAVDYRLIRNDVFIVEVVDIDTGTSISGADVYIDGFLYGETNAEGKVTSFVERERSHTIRITSDEYLAYTDEVYIGSDMLVYTTELSKTLYPVTVSVYGVDKMPVGGASILIDGTNSGTTNEYGRTGIVYLDAGQHEVQVAKEGFTTVTKTVDADDTQQDVIIELEYADTAVTLTVHDSDFQPVPGASISVNDKYYGITQADGTFTTSLQSNVVYSISVEKDGYTPVSVSREIPLGATEITVDIGINSAFNPLYFGIIIAVILVVAVLYLKRGNISLKRRGKRPPKTRHL
ncbi:PEGA domain-containing protein [Methanogenium organophilum]|uniref:PEGA domain-containing protein n=1 Tax=Methanogenium organophilum TaxID=2199 RepID=A0A9X9S5N6_METOG|nr:carboxypeptidase regulatory-like domain-containing protein [Methanogenium organophilum]WAI01903.1 PEGA domain-containing protein [Methanogenium organophilum]